MKRIIFLVAIIFLQLNSFAQKEKGDTYIAKYKELAMAEMQRSGVPAAITLAQGILESKYGESDLCLQSNNHFGIKCKPEWMGDKVYHDDDAKHECFRSYPDAAASFRDHSDFLKNRPYYTDLFKLDPTDFEGWAYGLKKAGYATEKDYPQKLLKVINDYNLNQYSLLALQNQNNKSNIAVAEKINQSPVVANQNNAFKKVVAVAEKEEVEIFTKPSTPVISKEKKSSVYPDGIFTINHSKVILAKEGSSLLALANQYNISLSNLLAFNEMDEVDILPADSLIFLEKKLKRGAVDFHVTQASETLHSICQKEGVRMDAVLQYNKIQANMQPVTGEKIYLRAPAPFIPKTIVIKNFSAFNSGK
ncbi:MAG TPA: glucosaminidase domain-containing protein [Chitinophagaceae bacterium]|nr:glucosaminidase domain-containing protein [Chitinophagaceae bacterium]